eukprot:TRINITY_DN2060_c0_g1_i1.p1 TRINITY_DN2060_c0_g1~~TRINITY_DN2060_c0_g1_i1.p1  ORF type:complete len:690 (-),score=266.68 TRINITY_DN2060_c0_g1_i1:180-2249(-)
MKFSMKFVLAVAVGCAGASAAESRGTAIQKVIELMNQMTKKGEAEKEQEATQYAKFKQFCEMTLADKDKAIDKATNDMETLEADIQKAESDAQRLANEIAVHVKDAAESVEDQASATELREQERADFDTVNKDYTESIDALGRAIKSLKAVPEKREQAKEAFVQIKSKETTRSFISDDIESSLDAMLLETDAKGFKSDAPGQANAYESSSGGVIEMLEELQNKFLDERDALQKKETAQKHAYDMLIQGLKNQEASDKKAEGEKDGFKNKQLQAAAQAKSDLEDTTQSRAADQKYSTELAGTCKKKATDFKARQRLRADELEAIQKATEIISSGTVKGAGEKHLPSLIQMKKRASSALASLRAGAGATVSAHTKDEVIQFLQAEATALNSNVLSNLAQKLSAPDVSIIQDIKRMIENLVTKINKQIEEAATKKAYCDKELGQNKATRTEKAETAESLQAEIDELTASNSKLDSEVAAAGSAITKLNEAMSEATTLRQEEKKKNTKTIKEAGEAQTAVASALTVLKDFYEDASYATALLQKSKQQPEAPEVFGDEPYQGMSAAKGGVVGMMEVIESDFARLEAETTAEEAAAKKEYEQFMEDSKIDKTKKQKEVEHKSAKKTEQTTELNSLKGDLLSTQKELDAALAYFETLKPDCVDAGVDYAERKKQREEEIKDLEAAVEKLGFSMEEE